MTDFQFDIKERLTQLTETNELSKKKAQFQKVYFKALVDTGWNEVTAVDDFQTAFLDLLNERYPETFKHIREPLEQRFYEMYKNSEDENERNYTPKAELIMHRIQVPSPKLNRWQLMYEMNSDDTIFHVEFEDWSFKTVCVTH